MRIRCTTQFDITATGVTGNHSRNRLPFTDNTGTLISDISQWERSRNQQRNWETILQILNLRTLLEYVENPKNIEGKTKTWQFDFEIERPSSLELNGDPLGALKLDCEGVPMISRLDEEHGVGDYLIYGRNIDFDIVAK